MLPPSSPTLLLPPSGAWKPAEKPTMWHCSVSTCSFTCPAALPIATTIATVIAIFLVISFLLFFNKNFST